MDMSQIVAVDNYLVYGPTGEKVVWYECDPCKNTECDKTFCRMKVDEDQDFGFCAKTANPAFRKDGSRAWYAVLKSDGTGEPYWGREYIEGV